MLIAAAISVASLGFTVYSLYNHNFDFSKIDWKVAIAKAVATWIILALWAMVNTIQGVFMTIKVAQGQFPSPNSRATQAAIRKVYGTQKEK
jgi:hypothetical protein